MKYKIGDRVIHSREGLSTIMGEASIAGNDYFVVVADKGDKENIYVLKNRTDNIIRPIMSKEEAQKVFDYMRTVGAEFISNTKQRRDQYRRRLLSGSVYDLAYLSRQLYFYYYYNENGQVVKLGPTDLQMLKDAERILFDELSLSLELSMEDLKKAVKKALN